MDFNDIQSAWNNDQGNKVKLPENFETLQTANTPLDKIRKNLKNEFVYQILAIVFMGLIPFVFKFSPLMKTVFYALFVLFLVICTYFLAKLYWFFKRLNQAGATTKDNLYDTYYDIRLNMELYKSFSYSLAPFALIFSGMIFVNDHLFEVQELLQKDAAEKLIWIAIAVFVIMTASIAFMTEWWVNYFYGKYAREIRKVIDELKEE